MKRQTKSKDLKFADLPEDVSRFRSRQRNATKCHYVRLIWEKTICKSKGFQLKGCFLVVDMDSSGSVVGVEVIAT